MDELRFRVPGMTCAHCVAAIEAEVGRVAGVEHVSADLDTKGVEVVGAGLDWSAISAAVDEAGYEAEVPAAGDGR
jgi:copper ion binding protein